VPSEQKIDEVIKAVEATANQKFEAAPRGSVAEAGVAERKQRTHSQALLQPLFTDIDA
jgi:hypothetical protein